MSKILNLKEHFCGTFQQKQLSTPCDLEVHRGTDGKIYLIDFSRLMPPENPHTNKSYYFYFYLFFYFSIYCFRKTKFSYLYELLRPELVREYKVPLSSDAFSRFSSHSQENKINNNEIKEATNYLFDTVIPKFSFSLLNSFEKSENSLIHFNLTNMLHNMGINIRMIFRVVESLCSLKQKMVEKSSAIDDLVVLLFCEMIARILKIQTRKIFRKRMKELRSPVEEPFITIFLDFLNVVFGNNQTSEKFWVESIPKKICQKFCCHINNFDFVSNTLFIELKKKIFHFANKSYPVDIVFKRLKGNSIFNFLDNFY